MNSSGILKAYNEAKKQQILTYLAKPTRGSSRKCLLAYLESNAYNKKHDDAILRYFSGTTIKTIKAIKDDSKDDDFKSIAGFLSGSTQSIRKHGSIALLKILLDFDINHAKETLQDLNAIGSQETSTEIILESLSKVYLNNTRFNSIHINGDFDNIIGSLPMKHYFIQLSYLSLENMKNRDSLLQLEKENSYYKTSNNQGEFFGADSKENQAAYNILNTIGKIVITGNPGVGKSTFARWLCYNSANNLPEQKTLFYFQLRDVNFNESDFLLSYLKETYFSELIISDQSLSTFIEQFDRYQLVLDGFDELPKKNKKKLLDVVQNYNYILLSRPYGILAHDVIFDLSYQIDGLNSTRIKQYINAIVSKKKYSNRSSELLLNTIKNNQVLSDYAHNPLMLSYICFIYITAKNPKDILSSIQSVYGLQLEVYSWITEYAHKKDVKLSISYKFKRRVNKFAFDMLIQKKYVCEETYDSELIKIADYLSALGLGSKTRSSKHPYQWQFSFDTVTFQEFLAAQYLEESELTDEAICYLITDHFFWNVTILLFGLLTLKHNRKKLITDSLQLLLTTHSTTTLDYYLYAYYMLLAECDHKLINTFVTKNDLSFIIESYKSVDNDPFWTSSNYDSIRKIFYKLSPSSKKFFAKEISLRLEEIISIDLEDYKITYVDYLADLIKLLKGVEDDLVITSLSKVLQYLLKLNKKKNEETDDHFYASIITYDYLDMLLNFSTPELLLKHKKILSHILHRLDIFNNESQELNSLDYFEHNMYNYIEKVVLVVEERINYKAICDSFSSQLEQKYSEHFGKTSIHSKMMSYVFTLSYYLFKLTVSKRYVAIISSSYIKEKVNLIRRIIKNMDDDLEENEPFLKELSLTKEFATSSLISCNDPILYNFLFDTIIEFEEQTYFEIPNNEEFIIFIKTRLKEFIDKKDFLNVSKIIVAMESTKFSNIKYNFYKFETLLFQLTSEVIESEYKSFKDDHFIKEYPNDVSQILLAISELPVQSFNKKHFLDFLVENGFSDLDFIKRAIIIEVLLSTMPFYEDEYWQLLFTIFEYYQWDYSKTIPILMNEDLYLFETNHPHLMETFLRTFNNENLTKKEYSRIQSDQIHEVITMLFYGIFSHSESLKKNFLKQVESILKNPNIKYKNSLITAEADISYDAEYAYETGKGVEDAISNVTLANIFIYVLRMNSDNLLLEISLEKQLQIRIESRSLVINDILNIYENFTHITNIEDLLPVIGLSIYTEVCDLINRRLLNKDEFDQNYLLKLLNQKKLNY